MPALSKKSLSLFIRNGCERQFIFSLYGDPERKLHNLPPRQKARFALGLVGEKGYEWQDLKVSELREVFGEANVLINPVTKGRRPGKLDLLTNLARVQPYQFIVEAMYDPDTQAFRDAFGFNGLKDYFGNPVDIHGTHPDVIQILPATFVGDPQQMLDDKRNPYLLGVREDGSTFPLTQDDDRLRLRVIDIKLASEPGAHYFAEVVYYSITLAAWLVEHHLDEIFVVIAAPAVWPGSHQASKLAQHSAEWKRKAYDPTPADIALGLEEDLEIATFEVFVNRLRRLLGEQLPNLLSKPWQALAWHVDYHCKGCEFLGYLWKDENGNVDNDPNQCWSTAEVSNHLSRVFGLSRGASEQLRHNGVTDIATLAVTSSNSLVFNNHQGLRAKRTTYPFRASSLQKNITSVIPNSGGDALMPRWPNLHVYLFLDYDLSTAITAAIALRAFWVEPRPFGSSTPPQKKRWPENKDADNVFLIDIPEIERERDEFIKFMRLLKDIFNAVIQQDQADVQAGRRDKKTNFSSYQIYLWDESQRKHLVRLVGRHLPYLLADPHIRDLAWLFPSPELLRHPEDATRKSPITLVSNVVENTVSIPVPHHYRLIDVVQTLKPQDVGAPSLHPHYQEPFSDLIPAERIHEWWKRLGQQWFQKQEAIARMVQKKVYALSLIVSRLEQELKQVLSPQAAPPLIRLQNHVRNVTPQGRLWLEFTRLNAALESLEVHTIRSMPLHEREARLKSARLTRRLSGSEAQQALTLLSQSHGRTLPPANELLIYEIAPDSREVNLKPGEFLYALAPEARHGFLDEHPYLYTKGTSLENVVHGSSIADAGMTSVKVEAIDRVNGLIALSPSRWCCITQLERETSLDFSKNVVLDPYHKDFLTAKVELTVQGIGNPPNAMEDTRTLLALGMPTATPTGKSAITPAAEVLWEAPKLSLQSSARSPGAIRGATRAKLETLFVEHNTGLDESQWNAWQEALSRRFSLIWGPPGTGKSHTLRAIVLGAVLDAIETQKPLRLLITANTYTAVDNVLLGLEKMLKWLSKPNSYELYRIQSKWRLEEPDLTNNHFDLKNLILNTAQPSTEVLEFRQKLEHPEGIIIVGGPPQQLHNLAVTRKSSGRPKPSDTVRAWFDLIILDEASQMDVASSTLVFSKLSPGGSCILAGDDLQLPPVQQAEPPLDLEDLVGSAYNYFRRHHGIIPYSLDINYRSNKTLVEFTRLAGYSAKLTSYSPDLKLHLVSDIQISKPADWPSDLYWTTDWRKFLDPASPAVCFVYEDQLSSQINEFEADCTAALMWLLFQHQSDQLESERKPGSLSNIEQPTTTFTPTNFWAKAVGVVTPHRVQRSKIVYRLQQVFQTHSPEDIHNAVDTVERFQGQQRDVIIASLGLGDPDIISAEDEFLYNLNRFNVLTSRPRVKVILFVTRSLLDHLSDDIDVLQESRLIKQFAEAFCTQAETVELGFNRQGTIETRKGTLRRA